MRSFEIRRRAVLPILALASVALMAPLAPQAEAKSKSNSGSTPGPPRAFTGDVGHVTGNSAVLEGSIEPHTFATTYYFQYGATAAYGAQTTAANLPAGTTTVKVSQTATGLLPGYHYRLVATNADGMSVGHDRIFTSKKKPTITLPKVFAPTPLGGTFTLSGTLTGVGNANHEVVLQATPYPYSGAYTNVGSPILTDATGKFTFHVSNMTTNTKFRVATVGTAAPVYSFIVPEQVSVHVVLKVRSSGHPGLVRLYGTVTPAEVGAHVFFQLEKPAGAAEKAPKTEQFTKLENPKKNHGKSETAEELHPTFLTKFNTIVKRGTKAISRFSAVVSVTDAGHYRAFVSVRPGPLASGHSVSVVLHAPPSSNKKKSKKKRK